MMMTFALLIFLIRTKLTNSYENKHREGRPFLETIIKIVHDD